MARSDKKVQWYNALQNHQNGHPLPVLDSKVASYEAVELYQWEVYIQFLLCRASTKIPTVDIEDKIKKSIKLHKSIAKT
eukprot:6984984-Ditylum_brightwellii.AAC.1